MGRVRAVLAHDTVRLLGRPETPGAFYRGLRLMALDGFTVEGALCDVADPEQVQEVVAKTIAAFGQIDILINNASIVMHRPFGDLTHDDFQATWNVNVGAAFNMMKAVWPIFVQRRSGRILNVSSVSGVLFGKL